MPSEIQTVTGPIAPEELGRTLMHEHLLIGYPGWDSDTLHPGPNRDEMRAVCSDRIDEIRGHGVRSMLDPCPADLGRDVEFMADMAGRTGFQIICATGLYKQSEGGVPYWHFRSNFGSIVNAMAELFEKELAEGIGETGVRAGIIKVASGPGKITDYERQILEAAAKASVATGAPITTHTDKGTMGDEQQRILTELGVPPHRILIGHSCGTSDHEYHRKIANGGSYLGFDRFGLDMVQPDTERIAALMKLIEAGAGGHLVVSHDSVWCWKGQPFPPEIYAESIKVWNPNHFFERVIPQLRDRGATEAQIERLLVENPRAFFAGEKPRPLDGKDRLSRLAFPAMASDEPVKGIQQDNVTQWFVENVPQAKPPFRFSLIAGGHSNLTYRVEDASGEAFVLRRPPLGAVIATAHDMGRENRIVSALGPTKVPVPPALGLCQDEAVNDAPFYVMGFVAGHVLVDSEGTAKLIDEGARAKLSDHVVEVLADLHDVDPDAVGLGDLGRKEAYLARQIKRWSTQWEKTKTRELPAMEEVAAGLQRLMPEQIGASIVHGDYRLGNMLSLPEGRVAAVLDWELCTLGDPMADIGYIMNNWGEPGEVAAKGAAPSPTHCKGFASRAEFLERYSERTGRDTSKVNYYRAFQYWRLAGIVEGVLARYLKGVMGNAANTDLFRQQVDGLAFSAVALLEELD